MKIGIFLPNWVGDMVMATPMLRALRRRYGEDARLIGILRPYLAALLDGTALLDERWYFDPYSSDPDLKSWSLLRRMYRSRFDLVVLLPNSFRPACLAWLARAGQRVGYARRRWRAPLLTLKPSPPTANGRFVPHPTLDYYLQLAYALGCDDESAKMELATTGEDEAAADALWRDLDLPGKRVVTFNSSGAFGAAKLWPDKYFGELARLIVAESGHDVLILCGDKERKRAANIVKMARSSGVKSLAGRELSLGLSKACVRRSRLLVTTDSGPRHFAAAFDVPVVSLFGPTHIAWSDTRFEKEVQLQIPVECGPCQRRICPRGHHKCMKELGVDEVFGVVRGELQRPDSDGAGFGAP